MLIFILFYYYLLLSIIINPYDKLFPYDRAFNDYIEGKKTTGPRRRQ